jgi:hypothetical protein
VLARESRLREPGVPQRWRVGLGAATVIAGVLHVPTLLAAPIGLACLFSIGELLAPPKQSRDAVVRFLMLCGIIISTLVLVGLSLNFVPGGLTSSSWSIAIGSLEIVCALVVGRKEPTLTTAGLREFGANRVAAVLLACVIASLAFVVATRGANESQSARPLEMFETRARGRLEIVVRGGATRRQYRLRFDGENTRIARITAGPGLSARINVPRGPARLRIDLLAPHGTKILRYLILAPEERNASSASNAGGNGA